MLILVLKENCELLFEIILYGTITFLTKTSFIRYQSWYQILRRLMQKWKKIWIEQRKFVSLEI